MTEHDSRWLYRQMIDAMVVACLQGPGRVSAERIRVGVWNPNADADTDYLADGLADAIAFP